MGSMNLHAVAASARSAAAAAAAGQRRPPLRDPPPPPAAPDLPPPRVPRLHALAPPAPRPGLPPPLPGIPPNTTCARPLPHLQRGGRFFPVGEAPDRVPAVGFALPDPASWFLLGCRHGRALLRSRPGWLQLRVWDPVTGHCCCVFLGRLGGHVQACNATILGDPVDLGRREGSFRVAFVFTGNGRASACVYSSETGAWGSLITAEAPCDDVCMKPSALVGDTVYWLLDEGGILELHLGKESLALTEPPPHGLYPWNTQLMEADAGVLGFAALKEYSLRLWAREADRDGTANWVLRTVIDLGRFAPPPGVTTRIMLVPPIKILGFDEGGNFAFLGTIFGIFMLSLDAVLLKKVSDAKLMEFVHPYSSFYVVGGVGGGEGDYGNSELNHN